MRTKSQAIDTHA